MKLKKLALILLVALIGTPAAFAAKPYKTSVPTKRMEAKEGGIKYPF